MPLQRVTALREMLEDHLESFLEMKLSAISGKRMILLILTPILIFGDERGSGTNRRQPQGRLRSLGSWEFLPWSKPGLYCIPVSLDL